MAIDQGQKKTNPSPYDQVIVMSQRFINASFARMWQEAPYDDPLKLFERTGPRTQDMVKVTFEPPQIFIPAFDRDYPGQVYLRMKVLRGRIYLYSNSTNQYPDPFDMDGWDLYFKMRIRHKNSNRNDAKYRDYQNQSGFTGAIFELTQLYMGLSDPSNPDEAFDDRKSTYAATVLTQNAKENLKKVMADWVKSAGLEKPRVNLLGYVFTSQQPQTLPGAESSLVPKIIDYNVYPWRGPDGSETERDGIDENALCILVTTGSHQAPYPPGINYSGPFVERGATLCINANCFWEDWILRDFQTVARDTEIIVDRPPLSMGVPGKWNIGVKYHFGSKETPSSFRFQRHVTNGRTSWAWAGKLHKTRSNTVNLKLGGGKLYPMVIDETSQSWITIEPDSGDERMFSIKGRHVFYHALLWNKDKKYSQWVTLIADWHINFKLQAINDGGLEIAPQLRDRSWLTIQTKKGTIIRTNEGYLKNKATTMESELRKRLEHAVSQISKKLNQAFQVQHKFIMPASGVFAMRYPKFNNRGDLLVELEYLDFSAPNSRAVVPTEHVVDNTQESDHFPFHKIPSISQDYPSRQPVDHDHHCLTREHFQDDVYDEYHIDEDEFHGDHHYHPGEHDDEHEDHRPDSFKHTERNWPEPGDSPFHSDNEPDSHKPPDKKTDGHTPDERADPDDHSRPHRRPQPGRTGHKDYANDDDDYY
ncbi:uncharacterized protein Aud_004401 [Aspergillus udagawae]|uniref:Uncharacterized protein n=1 Tax=Aspergillus udagawae TaxID=91492 RepID=A0A8E0QPA6_9EURO|nr:uncharacterized protein Aud_004401 [Aspergillus udagawae]GIC88010.1 hypothetical protein Aud_004401 [Aspergillus udagawae]